VFDQHAMRGMDEHFGHGGRGEHGGHRGNGAGQQGTQQG
jgi:hypothetical protein